MGDSFELDLREKIGVAGESEVTLIPIFKFHMIGHHNPVPTPTFPNLRMCLLRVQVLKIFINTL